MRVYYFMSRRIVFKTLLTPALTYKCDLQHHPQLARRLINPKRQETIEHRGGINKMADDRMKNDDVQRNMGTKDEQDFGRQSPGRSGQAGQQGGQHSGGQHGGQQGGQQGGQFGGQKGARNMDDDEDFDTGKSSGGQNRGGQNR